MLAGAGVHMIVMGRVWPAGRVNPVSGEAWTAAASQPGAAVMLPATTSAGLSLRSVIEPDAEALAASSTTWTWGSAWKVGAAAAPRALARAARTVNTPSR